jgi:hypothetical protein
MDAGTGYQDFRDLCAIRFRSFVGLGDLENSAG